MYEYVSRIMNRKQYYNSQREKGKSKAELPSLTSHKKTPAHNSSLSIYRILVNFAEEIVKTTLEDKDGEEEQETY